MCGSKRILWVMMAAMLLVVPSGCEQTDGSARKQEISAAPDLGEVLNGEAALLQESAGSPAGETLESGRAAGSPGSAKAEQPSRAAEAESGLADRQINGLDMQINTLSEQMGELEASRRRLQHEVQGLVERREQLEVELLKARNAVGRTQEDASLARRKLEELEGQRKTLLAEADRLDIRIRSQRRQRADLEAANRDLRERLSLVAFEVRQLEGKRESLRAKLASDLAGRQGNSKVLTASGGRRGSVVE